MFVRPDHIAAVVANHPEIRRARLVVGRENEQDTMVLKVEGGAAEVISETLRKVTKLRGAVEVVAPASLPADGIVIEDTRNYD